MPKRVCTKKSKVAKGEQWEELQNCCCKYSKILFVEVDNVTSKQISILRKELRAINAQVFMGKNVSQHAKINNLQTHMKAAIDELIVKPEPGCANYESRKAKWQERPHLQVLVKQLVGNVGMIFSNGDLTEIKAVLDKQAREAPAKPGMIAPADVTVQPGPTGLDPKQTSFFQALSIQTKIVKAQIEIANPVKVIKEGDKINQSQAALLDKLKIRPFEYKMHVRKVMDGGKIYPASVLNIKNDDILKAFVTAGTNLTATSLGCGYIVSSAAPHLILNAFKNLACAGLGGGYSFPQAEKFKNSGAASSAPASAPAKTEDKPAAKKEEPKKDEPEEDMDMGGLFD